MPDTVIKTMVNLTDKQRVELKKHANALHISMSALLRIIVKNFLDRKEQFDVSGVGTPVHTECINNAKSGASA